MIQGTGQKDIEALSGRYPVGLSYKLVERVLVDSLM